MSLPAIAPEEGGGETLTPEQLDALKEANRKIEVANAKIRERDRLEAEIDDLHAQSRRLIDEQDLSAAVEEHAEEGSQGHGSRSLVEVMGSMPIAGERLSTGIPALDRCLRGGLATGRVYGIVGPPHRGKTAGVAQLAREIARRYGIPTACLFADEGDWQAALMMLEGLGFRREDLEDRFADIREEVAARSASLDIRLFNPDMNVEAVVARLDREGLAGERLVLVADSAQRARTAAGEQSVSPKERADAFMKLCRGIVRARSRWIVLFTSKANRASWAKRDPADRLDYLAAGLDSSAIEYESDFLAFLEGDTEAGITMHVMKNRPGDGSLPSILLRFDRATATFAEVDSDVAESQAEEKRREAKEAKWSASEQRVLDGLHRHPGKSQGALAELIGIRPATLKAVLEELKRKGKAALNTDGQTHFWTPTVSREDE